VNKFKFPSPKERNVEIHIIKIKSIWSAIDVALALKKEGFSNSASAFSTRKMSKKELAFPFSNVIMEVLSWKENDVYGYQFFTKEIEDKNRKEAKMTGEEIKKRIEALEKMVIDLAKIVRENEEVMMARTNHNKDNLIEVENRINNIEREIKKERRLK